MVRRVSGGLLPDAFGASHRKSLREFRLKLFILPLLLQPKPSLIFIRCNVVGALREGHYNNTKKSPRCPRAAFRDLALLKPRNTTLNFDLAANYIYFNHKNIVTYVQYPLKA